MFTLKLKSWLEVRPLEWSSLTGDERIAMCRSARKALVDMKIPRSEPAWDHIKLPVKGAPRPSLPTATAAAATAGPSKAAVAQRAVNDEPPKRGLSSKDVKEKKAAKSKADATARGKTEIRMKDESVKASPRPTAAKRDPDVMDWTSTTAARGSASTSKSVAATSATRKVPGSGFITVQTAPQDSRSEAPDRSRASPIARTRPVNGRTVLPPATKTTATASPTIVEEKKYGLGAGANVRIKKIKTDPDGREKSLDRSQTAEGSPSGTLKRKKPVKEEDEEDVPRANTSLQKRRKTEENPRPVPSASTSAVPRAKDLSLPKKPIVPIPGRAIKKEPSPLNPPVPHKTKKTSPLQQSSVPPASSSSLPQHHTERRGSSKLSASSKSRRKSPIYTSSEDEDEIRRPEKQRDVLPTTSTSTSSSSASSTAGNSSRSRPPQTPLPLPKDHAGLRLRYRTTYKDYLATFQKLVAQQDKIETLLSQGGDSVTDSDGDLMDTDDLSKLSEDHKRLSEELVCIRRMFGSPPSG